jgi:hypothetical protein
MNLNKRLVRLEKQTPPSNHTLAFVVQDVTKLRQWLRQKGVTPEQALALGMTGPPGLHPYVSIAKLVEARASTRQWRLDRFGSAAGNDEAETSTAEA